MKPVGPPPPPTPGHEHVGLPVPRIPMDWEIRLLYLGGRKPWSAFITHGTGHVGEPGSTTYASKRPEGAVRKALKAIAKMQTGVATTIRIGYDRG